MAETAKEALYRIWRASANPWGEQYAAHWNLFCILVEIKNVIAGSSEVTPGQRFLEVCNKIEKVLKEVTPDDLPI